MTRTTDPLFDQRIADWLEDDPQQAPAQVLEIVLAALPSIPRTRTIRAPGRFIAMPMAFRLAFAVVAVIAVLGLGGAVYLNLPAVGGPSPTSGLNATPSQPASPSDRKSTRLNSSHLKLSRMPSSA